MSHIIPIVKYPRIKVFAEKAVNASDVVLDTKRITPVVHFVYPEIVNINIRQVSPIYTSIWDLGASVWDVDGLGNPQTRWDLEL